MVEANKTHNVEKIRRVYYIPVEDEKLVHEIRSLMKIMRGRYTSNSFIIANALRVYHDKLKELQNDPKLKLAGVVNGL